jgi:hypothetical protein
MSMANLDGQVCENVTVMMDNKYFTNHLPSHGKAWIFGLPTGKVSDCNYIRDAQSVIIP